VYTKAAFSQVAQRSRDVKSCSFPPVSACHLMGAPLLRLVHAVDAIRGIPSFLLRDTGRVKCPSFVSVPFSPHLCQAHVCPQLTTLTCPFASCTDVPPQRVTSWDCRDGGFFIAQGRKLSVSVSACSG
jgi:hypothetical protein